MSNSSMIWRIRAAAFDSIMAETLKAVLMKAQRTALYTKAEQQLDKDWPLFLFITT
ncbi:hypothetical protein ACNKHN_07000 [Shigella flexneri]